MAGVVACSAVSMAGQPSNHSASPASGGTANSDDQVMKPSMSTLPAARWAMLPRLQPKAAPSTRTMPVIVTSPPVWPAITATPPNAKASAPYCRGFNRSPLITIAMAMVKTTWLCTIRLARPAAI